MGVMGARRLLLGVLVCVCTMSCVLVGGAGLAWAAGGSFLFGSLGEEAGQIEYEADGMAVDRENGDIYVSDSHKQRIEEFDQSGKFLLEWGGVEGSGAGEFSSSNAYGVAVDNEPGASHGDVYVVDAGNYRVQAFTAEGKFLRMFGGHVNKDGADVCVAGEECQAGTQGTGDGEFDWAFEKAFIAVGPGGDVYVGDKARVQVFEPSGVWKENISLSALSSEGKVTALAVNAVGDVFVKVEGVPGVRGFEAGGIEMLAKFDEGSETVQSIALGVSGDLFISQGSFSEEGSFKEYGPSGEELASFGGHTLIRLASGMVFDEALKELLAYGTDEETSEYGHFGVWGFAVPPPGPLVESGSEKVVAEPRGAATFEGVVDPEGHATEVRFEYVDEADFKTSGYASATRTAPVLLAGSGFGEEHVEVALPQKTLVPGVTYHWRIMAHNALGSNPGADESFEEIPPAYVEGPWATSVAATSVTLSANIDPVGANTTYRLEYGTSTAYGHVLVGNVGDVTTYVPVTYHVQELEPGTTYHYRVVTSSEVGPVEGVDHTFTTQPAGGALALPDGRAWELVSPADKGGALIENIEVAQAASDGSGIAYSASEPIGENVSGHLSIAGYPSSTATILSERTAGGWRTRDISPKQTLPAEGTSGSYLFGASEAFHLFSPDLSLAVFAPSGTVARQSNEATELTPYLRDNASETYLPLVTPVNVPPGTRFGPHTGELEKQVEIRFLAATPDLTHVVLSSPAMLTPEALTSKSEIENNLFEWSGGRLQLVSVLPEGKQTNQGMSLGAQGSGGYGMTAHAISSDGRWIVFRSGATVSNHSYYVRDMVEKKTVQLGREDGFTDFETMSSDGSKVFYLEPENEQGDEEGELYVLDPATGVKTNITTGHLDGEPNAGVQSTLVGASEDGSYVYFVAKGVLADGATKGQDNLYVSQDNGGEWTITFIATLSSEDQKDWRSGEGGPVLRNITSRVSSNGRYVAFMSDRSLTGYDNHDAVSGQPDEEAYLYDAVANRLACVSCNPTGARPVGVDDVASGDAPTLLMDQNDSWDEEGGHWLAAILPPAWHGYWSVDSYQPRSLSDEGRLFFDSSDALVPQDTNGLADVYEYEPAGVGDCRDGSVTFSERSGGCVGLISSGQSADESTFFDASESGDDVFFITTSKLVGEDYDTSYDVYDAHVCSTAVPCHSEPVSPPPCTSGDSCKAAPSPQPAIFGTAPSATFNGEGNVVALPASGVKSKSLTNAQKLARALKTCHKKKSKRKRVVCERQARKHYPVKSGKAKTSGKGER